jgi:MFS family permease
MEPVCTRENIDDENAMPAMAPTTREAEDILQAITSAEAICISLLFSTASSCSCVASVMVGALEADLVDTGLLTTNQVGILSLAYAIPNLFFPIVCGHEMDRVGPKLVGTATMVIVLVGNIIYATSNTFAGMLLGNFIMGVGGGATSNFALVLVHYWFGGTQHQGKGTGVLAMICNLSQTFAFLSLETIANSTSLTAAKTVGVLYSAMCFICLFVYFWLEPLYSRYLVLTMRRRVLIYPCLCCVCMHPQVVDADTEEYKAVFGDQSSVSTQQAANPTGIPPSVHSKDSHCEYFTTLYRTIFGYGCMFWLQVATNSCAASVLYAWPNFLEVFLIRKYQFSENESSYCTSVITAMFLLAPLGGAATDYVGHRLHTQTVSLFFILLGIGILETATINPWIPVSWAGFWFASWQGNSFVLSLQCAAADQPNTAGFAMGIRFSITSMVFGIISVLAGAAGPLYQNHVFGFTLCISIACSMLMQIFDNDGRLNAITRANSRSYAVIEGNSQPRVLATAGCARATA